MRFFCSIVLAVFTLCVSALAYAGDLTKAPACPPHVAKLFAGLDDAAARLVSFKRTKLSGKVFQYKAVVKVGPGSYDKIGLYRVVKEKAPWIPATSARAVMMVPGDQSNFETNFLTASSSVPADQSLAIYLAENDIDVWGMDFRWAFVPDQETDFSFMQNWNTALHLQDVKTAVRLARGSRLLTGSGPGKVFLLGLSRGAQFVYAYANLDSQAPIRARDIAGIIPMDMVYKIAPDRADLLQASLARYQVYMEQVSLGIFASSDGLNTKYLASLALAAPDDPSEVMPGLTNAQALLTGATATYAIMVPPMQPYTPTYHQLAGVFDPATSLPIGLKFTNSDYAMEKTFAAPSYQSLGEIIDGEVINSSLAPTPFDDHLQDITVPVLYIGAAGGYGEAGLYTLTLLGSTDKTSNIVALYPPEGAALDFGHLDLVWAGTAKQLVWEPIRSWISAR